MAKYNNHRKLTVWTKVMTLDDIEYVAAVIGTLSSMLEYPYLQVNLKRKAADIIKRSNYGQILNSIKVCV